MPTDTFKNLPQEKKEKIIKSAEKEFARVPFAETSIKNIVERNCKRELLSIFRK